MKLEEDENDDDELLNDHDDEDDDFEDDFEDEDDMEHSRRRQVMRPDYGGSSSRSGPRFDHVYLDKVINIKIKNKKNSFKNNFYYKN